MPESGSHPERGDQQTPETTEEVVEGQVVDDRRRRSQRLDVGYQESRYTSPLPSPEDLQSYKELLPDAPERLLAAGEREQAHRHAVENRLVALDEKSMPRFYQGQKRAHYIGLGLGIAYLALMLAAVLEGYGIPGIVGAAAGIGAMIWAVRRDPGDPSPPAPQDPSADTAADAPGSVDQPSTEPN